MNFLSLVKSYIELLSRLGAQIYAIDGMRLLLSVFCFVMNQVSQVLIVFVPLKLLVVMGTGAVPAFILPYWPDAEFGQLVMVLGAASLAVYLIYASSDLMFNRIGKRFATKQTELSQRALLFDGQQEFSQDVYSKVARTYAGFFMVMAGFALGFVLDWRLFVFLLALLLLESLIMAWYWQGLDGVAQLTRKARFVKNRLSVLSAASSANFALVFIALLGLFLTERYSFLIAVLSILLARQIMIRFVLALSDSFFLTQQQQKISQLYFAEHQPTALNTSSQSSLFQWLSPEFRPSLLSGISTHSGVAVADLAWSWIDSGLRDVGCFRAYQDNAQLILKLYPRQQEKNFFTEKFMLELGSRHPLAPELICCGEIDGLFYVCIRLNAGEPVKAELRQQAQQQIRQQQYGFALTDEIKGRLFGVQPLLYQRFRPERLAWVAIAEQYSAADLNGLTDAWATLSDYMARLPMVLLNKLVNANTMFSGETGYQLLHWHLVSLELVGAGFSMAELEKAEAMEFLQQLIDARPDCACLTLLDFKLVVLVQSLEQQLNAQNLNQAAVLVSELVAVMSELGLIGNKVEVNGADS